MPRYTVLTEFERNKISLFDAEKKWFREISQLIKRTVKDEQNFLRAPQACSTKNHLRGRRVILSERQRLEITCLAQNSEKSLSETIDQCKLNIYFTTDS